MRPWRRRTACLCLPCAPALRSSQFHRNRLCRLRHILVEEINCFKIIGRGEIINADLVAFFHQGQRPLKRNGRAPVDFKHGFLPRGLVADLRRSYGKSRSPRRSSARQNSGTWPRLLRLLCARRMSSLARIQVAVMVGGDVGNEVGRMIASPMSTITNFDFHGSSDFVQTWKR